MFFLEESVMPDSITITLSATTMEGVGAVNPQVTIDIIEAIPLNQIISQQIVRNFNGTVTIAVPVPDGFPSWQVNTSFSKYDGVSGFFFQPRGNPAPSFAMQVTRLPAAWTPEFTPLQSLAVQRFQTFRNIVAVSTNVDLKNGPAVGDLNAKYDFLADGAQIQAKTALLNLFAVLTDEQDPIGQVPWFTYVRKIVRIDQERFIAEVDPTLFENVQTILNGLNGTFKGQGFFTEPNADLLLHVGNIPPQYGGSQNINSMITLKKDYEQGDLQLTMTFLTVAGRAVHLLDCDLDENRNILLHSLDLVKHLFNGGTSPISMHEYIVEDSAQNSGDGVSTVDLGYQLA
jgi:hypothetical protein